MTLEIPLTPEMEHRLRERAAAAGKDVTAFVLDALADKLSAPVCFDKVFAPIHEAFREGDVTGAELDQLLESALAALR
jgi:hypothetical protein